MIHADRNNDERSKHTMTSVPKDNSWINITRKYHKCPHCKKGTLDTRVKRGFFVKNFFIWLGTKRYQCNTCGRKCYIKN